MNHDEVPGEVRTQPISENYVQVSVIQVPVPADVVDKVLRDLIFAGDQPAASNDSDKVPNPE
jgi:hypothetical protein